MDLSESRRKSSELSGGTSSDDVKELVCHCLEVEQAQGSLLDFGAGKGELLRLLHATARFQALAGIDLFGRPRDFPAQIDWYQQDLNEVLNINCQFDVVVCSETIEHLENPRHTFRVLSSLLNPGGLLVITMPNQESIRSYSGLLIGGHFTHFLGESYPAHITALLSMDLLRISAEVGFTNPTFRFSNSGGIPKIPSVKWQDISFGLLKGKLFSDNVAMTAYKLA